ncbi:hypothetical protein CISIN_1g0237091mg, partial [Citrus sinensis]
GSNANPSSPVCPKLQA